MTAPLRLILDLESVGEPVSGRLRRCGGDNGRAFHGYVSLIAAIEDAREADAARATDAGSADA